MSEKYMHPGLELLCDLEFRKAWFADAKELQAGKSTEYNLWWDTEHDEETLNYAADTVLICGDAAEKAEELGNADLSNEMYDMACKALVAYLAILWDTALPEDMGGAKDIDHPQLWGEIDFYQLGMDTRSKRDWVETRVLDGDSTRLMVTATDWWRVMWEEIEDIKERGEK